jgi:hypothetical protein
MNAEEELRKIMREELLELRKDVKEIRAEMQTLKVKVAVFSSIIGSVATLIAKKLIGA